jgi:hypothetical protein
MPRDGDPMSPLPDTFGPDVFGPRTGATTRSPEVTLDEAPPPLPRPGKGTIFLHATNTVG